MTHKLPSVNLPFDFKRLSSSLATTQSFAAKIKLSKVEDPKLLLELENYTRLRDAAHLLKKEIHDCIKTEVHKNKKHPLKYNAFVGVLASEEAQHALELSYFDIGAAVNIQSKSVLVKFPDGETTSYRLADLQGEFIQEKLPNVLQDLLMKIREYKGKKN